MTFLLETDDSLEVDYIQHNFTVFMESIFD